MAEILKKDDSLKDLLERNITQGASERIGAEQDPQLGQYIVMMLLDSYVTEETIKSEIQTMTEGVLNDDFVAWCKEEMERVAYPERGSQTADAEMEDSGVIEGFSAPLSKENVLNGRKDRGGIGGVSKSFKERGGRSGISKAFSKDRGESAFKSKTAAATMDAQQAMFAAMQNAMKGDLPPQERFNQRCKKWPTCNFDNCKYVHPTEACEAFAKHSCPSRVGMCLKVHVGQDIDDLANLPEQPKPFKWMPYDQYKSSQPKFMVMPMMTPDGPQAMMVPQMPLRVKIVECRFTDRCGNQNCTFGHATPCNDKAVITDQFSWCEDKENCKNENCGLNHPSSSLVRQNESLPSGPSLEQCKFDQYCTNPKCRFRHATSYKVCRDGKGCTRIDCSFRHPADCKFGTACQNPACLYAHPNGKASVTAERKFINEGEDTEKLIPGQPNVVEVAAVDTDARME